MSSSLAVARRLFPWGFAAEFVIAAEIPEYRLPVVVDALLRQTFPSEAFSGGILRDLKGRDSNLLMFGEIAAGLKPSGEELLFASGHIPIALENEEIEELQEEEFQVRIHSQFSRFVGSHHIEHTVEELRRGALPEFVPLEKIARVFPLTLNAFRLGFDFFESRFTSMSFGYAPLVTRTVLIECSRHELRFKLIAEGLARRNKNPFAEDARFEGLRLALLESLALDLREEYQRQLR